MPRQFLLTNWGVDSPHGHDISIIHTEIAVTSMDQAREARKRVSSVRLDPAGRLYCTVDGREAEVRREDIEIRTSSNGGPLELATLAALLGAAGLLDSLAFGIGPDLGPDLPIIGP